MCIRDSPNTMQKALSELEREGYLESQRTSGRFVADRGKQIDRLKQDMALELCESFHNGMKKIGFTPEEAIAEYKEYISRIEAVSYTHLRLHSQRLFQRLVHHHLQLYQVWLQ